MRGKVFRGAAVQAPGDGYGLRKQPKGKKLRVV